MAAKSSAPESTSPWLKIFLGVACFLSGAGIMVVELAGNRLITPLFGNTLYTWTGLISVILIAIAAGDYIGGWWVDRRPTVGGLAWLFGMAAVLTVAALPLFEAFRSTLFGAGYVAGPIFATLFLFALPACVLAAVSPFTVRLLSRTSADQHIGLSAGTVGALATLGSFFGTLGTGLFLVPTFSLRAIFIGCALGLLMVALVAWLVVLRKPRPAAATVGVLGLVTLFAVMIQPQKRPGTVFHETSFYHDIYIVERTDANEDLVRFLNLDTTLEGGQVVATGEVVFAYQKFWRLASALTPNLHRALFLGGGGFGMPEQLQLERPAAKISVVELDPKVIETGHQYFRLDQFPQLETVTGDARRFLTSSTERYDLVFGDAYSGVNSVPGHLLTREFFTQVRDHLSADGIFMMNLISVIRGPNNGLFRAVYATLKDVFPEVAVFGVEDPYSTQLQNLILLASTHDLSAALDRLENSADAELRRLVAKRVDAEMLPAKIDRPLTDDANRAEWLAAMQLRAAAGRR